MRRFRSPRPGRHAAPSRSGRSSTPTATAVSARQAVDRAFREEAGRLTASLVRLLGDFDLAEELVQESLVVALETWPRSGVPDRPGAWLLTTARRRAIDRARRGKRLKEKLALLERDPPKSSEDRLRLIFTCCHPALAREAQVALTLRAVGGLTTAEIARAFLLPESTLAQRIVRAKRKIVEAGIPYRVPRPEEMVERLEQVLAVLYLLFNEGYLASSDVPERRELAEDAEWLCALLSRLMPREPEVLGLLALMRLHLARADARFDVHGGLVLLEHQDRARWHRSEIAGAVRVLERAASFKRPGPYQLQAAIAAVHCEAPTFAATDWHQIVRLYERLYELAPSPVVRLNGAVALSHVAGPGMGLAELDAVANQLDGYHLLHAARAVLLRQLGREDEARAADARALELTTNPAEQDVIRARLS
jgi:RNA polymerase sigma-70 factor (ECF subfamily)